MGLDSTGLSQYNRGNHINWLKPVRERTGIMRLKIDTSEVQFRVAGPVTPRKDPKNRDSAGHDAGRAPDLDGAAGRDRRRAATQGNHLGRGGRRRAQADLRWLRAGARSGLRTVGQPRHAKIMRSFRAEPITDAEPASRRAAACVTRQAPPRGTRLALVPGDRHQAGHPSILIRDSRDRRTIRHDRPASFDHEVPDFGPCTPRAGQAGRIDGWPSPWMAHVHRGRQPAAAPAMSPCPRPARTSTCSSSNEPDTLPRHGLVGASGSAAPSPAPATDDVDGQAAVRCELLHLRGRGVTGLRLHAHHQHPLTTQCRAWGIAVPRPGQPDQFLISQQNRRSWHVRDYQRAPGTPEPRTVVFRPTASDGHRVVYHEPICPDCGSFDIIQDEIDTGDGINELGLICDGCGTAWPVACVVDWDTPARQGE